MFHFKHITTKIIGLQVIVTLFLAVTIGSLSYLVISWKLDKILSVQLHSSAVAAAVVTEGFLVRRSTFITQLAQSAAIKKFRQSYNGLALTQYLSDQGNPFAAISIANEKGGEDFKVIDGQRSYLLEDITATPLYVEGLNTPQNLTIGSGYFSQKLNGPVLEFGHHNIDYFDNYLGFIKASVRLSDFSTLYDQLEMGESSFVLILDSSNHIIHSPHPESLGKPFSQHNDSVLAQLASIATEDGIADEDILLFGVPCRVALVELPEYQWKVLAAIPSKTFNLPLKELRNYIVILTIVSSFFAFPFSLGLAHSIVNPILILSRTINSIATNRELSQQVSVESHDEIGELADNFNKMVAEIHDSKLQLEIALEEAEKASKSKTEFLSSMSHELRTPMNAIIGFSELLQLDEKLGAQQLDQVGEIIAASDHLMKLIDQVLNLAKIESGNLDIRIEPVMVHEAIEECARMAKTQAEKLNIHIDYSQCKGISVLADKMGFRQVLLNFISNAIKYNHKGGNVMIDTQRRKENWLRIQVKDTGRGIPADKLDALYKPFNRLGAENSDIGGTGIGLTISKKLIEHMGGKIGVESEVGVGSNFWIELKLEPQYEETVI